MCCDIPVNVLQHVGNIVCTVSHSFHALMLYIVCESVLPKDYLGIGQCEWAVLLRIVPLTIEKGIVTMKVHISDAELAICKCKGLKQLVACYIVNASVWLITLLNVMETPELIHSK